jgi:hypothetical protein
MGADDDFVIVAMTTTQQIRKTLPAKNHICVLFLLLFIGLNSYLKTRFKPTNRPCKRFWTKSEPTKLPK